MQMCPWCDKVYDESEYSHCPYCSGELEDEDIGGKVKDCPDCGRIMYWDGCWECSNCSHTIDTDEDNYDSILEGWQGLLLQTQQYAILKEEVKK